MACGCAVALLLDCMLSYTSMSMSVVVCIYWWAHCCVFLMDVFFMFIMIFVCTALVATSAMHTVVAVCSAESNSMLLLQLMTCSLLVLIDDVLFFYWGFECLLLYMYMYLAILQRTARAYYALSMLAYYTILGSALLLLGLSMQYAIAGHGSMKLLTSSACNSYRASVMYIILHIAFACKVPCWPLHSWLLQAHSEASTDASIILASLYLKVGIVGWAQYVLWRGSLLTWALPIMVLATCYACSTIGWILSTTVDMKRFVAACSVAHLHLCICVMMCAHRSASMVGLIVQVLMHSLIATLLFFVVGDVYEVQGSRSIKSLRYGSSTSVSMLILLLANSGFPCSASYYAEVSMLITTTTYSIALTACIILIGAILALAGGMFWVQVMTGRSKQHPGIDTCNTSQATATTTLILIVIIMSTWCTLAYINGLMTTNILL
nr:NADH dehydrogenase subunit 4 [Diplonema sp. ATCC 50224]